MTPTRRSAKELAGMKGAVLGLVLTFVILAGLVRLEGLAWSSAAGIAALPAVFGGWYFGVLLALARSGGLEDTPDVRVVGRGSGREPEVRPGVGIDADPERGSTDRVRPMRPAA